MLLRATRLNAMSMGIVLPVYRMWLAPRAMSEDAVRGWWPGPDCLATGWGCRQQDIIMVSTGLLSCFVPMALFA